METTISQGAPRTLSVSGEIDHYWRTDFSQSVIQALGDEKQLILDLSEVSFLDSSAIGVVFWLAKKLRDRDGNGAVIVSDPHIRRVFELVRLEKMGSLVIFETGEQARQALSVQEAS